MKKNMKHRVLAVLSAVLCVVAMTLSVAVLPAMAYANITRNPLFAAALAAVTENDKGKDAKEKGKEAGKEGESNRVANGEAGSESNGVASVSNGNDGEGAKSGNDANGEKNQSNVPEHKSEEKGKQADKNKKNNEAKNKNAKEKAKNKANGKDRSAGDGEKLSLDQVKALPACEAYVFNDRFNNASVRFRPSSGSGNKCAISADAPISNFDSIRQKISKLGDSDPVDFSDVYVYAYGSLSKDGVGLFSGKNISSINSADRFDTSNVTDMSYLFKNSSLTNLNFLSKWNVGNVEDMQSMFEGCTGLEDINGLSGWDVSKVTDMSGMFASVIKDEDKRDSFNPEGYEGLMAIKSLKPLSNWNVGKVTNMNRMFEGCTSLKDFTGLENWDTKNVLSMIGMFRYCMKIGGGNESSNAFKNWDVSKVTDMRGMFAVTNIQNTDGLEKWNVSNVIAMDDMFAKCTNLDNIKELANWNKDKSSTSKLTSTFRMFYECNNISSIEPLKDWDVSNVENMHDMFNSCIGLTSLSDLAKWKVDKVTDMHGMFHGCSGLTSLEPLSNWATKVGNVKDMHDMFNGCSGLSDLSGLKNWDVNNVKNMSGMFSSCANDGVDPEKGFDISALSNWAKKVNNVTDMHGMFSGCEFLKSISDLKDWNVGNVTNMNSMFSGCKSLSSLSYIKDWNVGNVTNMSGMFADCKKLTSAEKLSNWATKVGNVTNMSSLFSGCELLANISDLKDWNVGNVTDMNNMFSWCKSLSSLSDLKGWKVDNVTDMHSMFEECIGLTNLSGLQDWNVGNVTNMCNMFSHSLVEGADNLTDISALSGWNVSNVTDMSGMFSDCKKLTGAADLSGWDISKVTNLSSMFSNAGAESGDNFVLDFSNKTFTKSKTPVANADPDDQSKHYFSVDGMFDGFKGTLIANNLQSSSFENNPDDDPIAKHFAIGDIFSLDENGHSNNIVVTNNVTILDAISEGGTPLKKIAYYIPVKAKLMEPGDMNSCKCDGSGDSSGTTTYYVPALYSSKKEGEEGSTESILRGEGEPLQDYAYRIVKNSFASKFRSAIDSQSGKEPGGDDTGDEVPGGNSRSARLKSRVKRLQSIKKSQSVRDSENEEEQGNTYKIWFKKPSEGGCTWTELGEGENGAVPVSEPKSPLTFFNTMYYLETFVKPVPLPHTGGQSAVMFTFLSIGLFSMFAVAGAFGRHGWVASVLSGTALTGFAKGFSCGVLDIAYGFKHCFAHSVAHSVVSGSMLKSAVSAATGFFARFRSNESTFGKHTKQR